MNLITIGKLLGELQGMVSSIDTGTFETKKNNINSSIKKRSLELIRDLEREIKENVGE